MPMISTTTKSSIRVNAFLESIGGGGGTPGSILCYFFNCHIVLLIIMRRVLNAAHIDFLFFCFFCRFFFSILGVFFRRFFVGGEHYAGVEVLFF